MLRSDVECVVSQSHMLMFFLEQLKDSSLALLYLPVFFLDFEYIVCPSIYSFTFFLHFFLVFFFLNFNSFIRKSYTQIRFQARPHHVKSDQLNHTNSHVMLTNLTHILSLSLSMYVTIFVPAPSRETRVPTRSLSVYSLFQ